MKCSICATHFKAENRDQDVCPNCLAAIESLPQMPEVPVETEEEVYIGIDLSPEVDSSPEVEIEQEQEVESNQKESMYPYKVRSIIETLHCHKKPGSNHPVIGTVNKNQIHEIFEEALGLGSSKWGKLADERGWIALDYCSRTL